MVKLADTLDLGPSGEIRGGSNPLTRTNLIIIVMTNYKIISKFNIGDSVYFIVGNKGCKGTITGFKAELTVDEKALATVVKQYKVRSTIIKYGIPEERVVFHSWMQEDGLFKSKEDLEEALWK